MKGRENAEVETKDFVEEGYSKYGFSRYDLFSQASGGARLKEKWCFVRDNTKAQTALVQKCRL